MAADLREMQKNQWVSEIRIDKLRFIGMSTPHETASPPTWNRVQSPPVTWRLVQS